MKNNKQQMKKLIDEVNGKQVKMLIVSTHQEATAIVNQIEGEPTEEEAEQLVLNSLLTLFKLVCENLQMNPLYIMKLLLTAGYGNQLVDIEETEEDFEEEDEEKIGKELVN